MNKLFDLSRNDPLEPEFDPWISWPYDRVRTQCRWTAFWLCCVFLLCLLAQCNHQPGFTRSYTDEEIAQAIKKAENPVGSPRAWTYGITSLPCSSEVQCHALVIGTIQHNRKRYAVSGLRRSEDFIYFLGSRYCPASEYSCKTWYKNVTYFLKEDNP